MYKTSKKIINEIFKITSDRKMQDQKFQNLLNKKVVLYVKKIKKVIIFKTLFIIKIVLKDHFAFTELSGALANHLYFD